MNFSEERKGELLVTADTLMWGLFPIITILSYTTLNPLASLGASTLVAAILFSVIVSVKRNWLALRNRSALFDMLMVGLLMGVTVYTLYYIGLQKTTAGNASLIGLTEIFFSYLLFNIWKKLDT